MKEIKLLDLTKKLELSLEKAGFINQPKMAVKLAVDKSGSMYNEFRCGWVQNVIDLFIAAAMKFDDNGKLEVGFFDYSFTRTRDATEEDIGSYVRKYGIEAGGLTNFAEAVEEFKWKDKKLFGLFKRGKSSPPVYICLITDGENQDRTEFEKQLDSLKNTYLQIIAIGNEVDEVYLQQVAYKYENVGVIFLQHPLGITIEQFYSMILHNEFKQFSTKHGAM